MMVVVVVGSSGLRRHGRAPSRAGGVVAHGREREDEEGEGGVGRGSARENSDGEAQSAAKVGETSWEQKRKETGCGGGRSDGGSGIC
jgi:hypothetical protein